MCLQMKWQNTKVKENNGLTAFRNYLQDYILKNQHCRKVRKREKNKKKNASESQGGEVEDLTDKMKSVHVSDAVSSTAAGTVYTNNPDELKEKRIKNLRKKLKQINELQARIDSGELKKPEAEQLVKLSKKEEVEKEIEDLKAQLCKS